MLIVVACNVYLLYERQGEVQGQGGRWGGRERRLGIFVKVFRRFLSDCPERSVVGNRDCLICCTELELRVGRLAGLGVLLCIMIVSIVIFSAFFCI